MCAHQVRSYGPSVNPDDRSTDTPSGASPADHSSTQQYEIRVKGHLGSRWAAWFDGLNVTNEDDGTTVIRGPVVDQAALHGLLLKLRDVGIPLVSPSPSSQPTPTPRSERSHPRKGPDRRPGRRRRGTTTQNRKQRTHDQGLDTHQAVRQTRQPHTSAAPELFNGLTEAPTKEGSPHEKCT